MIRLGRRPQRIIYVIRHIALSRVPLPPLQLHLSRLPMAKKGDQRLNTVGQAIRPFPDTLGAENVDLEQLSREEGHRIPAIV